MVLPRYHVEWRHPHDTEWSRDPRWFTDTAFCYAAIRLAQPIWKTTEFRIVDLTHLKGQRL